MTEPNFRALCAELIDKIDYTWRALPVDVLELVNRARAALDTPPPEPPTDKKLDDLWDEVAGYYNLYEEAREFGRRAWELGQ